MDQFNNGGQPDEQTTQDGESTRGRYLMNRRTVISALGLGATGFVLIGAGGEVANAASSTAIATSAATPVCTPACVLASELTEGPYYVALENIRSNITEGKPGIPLKLRVTVVDTNTCEVIKGAAIDIWHCDAVGSYSDEAVLGTAGKTFLRGTQLTNHRGVATFTTIYPGWYTGRAIHIHTKVHIGGSVVDGVYQGGHVSHTGQFFFDESVTEKIKLLGPYVNDTDSFTTLANDSIYPKANTAGALVALTPLRRGNIKAGFLADVVVGVDPTATPPTGGGPPGPPPPTPTPTTTAG